MIKYHLDILRKIKPDYGAPEVLLTAAALAAASASDQKQLLGQKLYPAIYKFQPKFADQITCMLLDLDNNELLALLETHKALRCKVSEVMTTNEFEEVKQQTERSTGATGPRSSSGAAPQFGSIQDFPPTQCRRASTLTVILMMSA